MRIDLNSLAKTFKDVEFFLVCLYPPSPPIFEGGNSTNLKTQTGSNFWAITPIASPNGQELIGATSMGMVLFRGYDADLGIHSYSPPEAKEKIAHPSRLQNGVFAYIRMGCAGLPPLIKSDPLGVAPIYYRILRDGGYIFASHPSLLHLDGDSVNLTGWMSMMQNGFFYGDESFYKEIQRVPAGTELTIYPKNVEKSCWFDIDKLPKGDQKVDDNAFEIVEAAYAEGMGKLLALCESRVLPLSSGYDSRRFFATMVDQKLAFKAVTCQAFHRKKGLDYDIDSVFAPKIAKHFGIDCEVVRASPPEAYRADNLRRLSLIGTESFLHAWAVPLMRWMAKQPMSIVFDGLAGDTLGNSGYEFPGLHKNSRADIEVLMTETVDISKFDQLSKLFPTAVEFKATYRAYLERYPRNLNGAELAFLQGRTRRCISPWMTMMHPPGHVVVYPYYNINFIRATLRYHPAEKYQWFFQKECLRRSYPAYFDFPGSRNIPAEMKSTPKNQIDSMAREAEKFVYDDKSVVLGALKYLAIKNKILLVLSTVFRPLRSRRHWLFQPILLLVKTDQAQKSFIKLAKQSQNSNY